MTFEHGYTRPDTIHEDWENQFKIFSWIAYLTAIPHVIFLVTTLKENGQPNAALHGWASFTGEGDNYYVIMPVMKHTHTYRNIQRDGEFCINFLSAAYVDMCKETIRHNTIETDEIAAAGLTREGSATRRVPRIEESFLKLECTLQWEKALCPDSTNITVCGKVAHLSVDERFVTSPVTQRYGQDSFVFHLMAMKNPYTGERLRGGIGRIELTREMEL